MRTRFDEELDRLSEEMTRMGMLCETAIRRSSGALFDHDMDAAKSIPELLETIDAKDREIQNICFRLLMQQQPVAQDLRTISAALKMVTDMDRIGVQAADIAEIVTMDSVKEVDPRLPLREMADAAVKMVSSSIDAFVRKDTALAQAVIDMDDVVDRYFDTVKAQLITELKGPEERGVEVLDLLMIAKYLERIADHAVNISTWVIFSITGDHERIK